MPHTAQESGQALARGIRLALDARAFLTARLVDILTRGGCTFGGDSPGGWHTGIGGGIWLAFLDRSNTATLGITGSGERTSVYGGLGFGF